jgi:hypothetical protein
MKNSQAKFSTVRSNLLSLIKSVCHVSSDSYLHITSLKDIRLFLFLEIAWISVSMLQIVEDTRFVAIVTSTLSLINATGLIVAACFYRHNVRFVLNCTPCWSSLLGLWAFLGFIRPLEMIWRFATYRLRVLPDLFLVGETRCGTTSFAGATSDEE